MALDTLPTLPLEILLTVRPDGLDAALSSPGWLT